MNQVNHMDQELAALGAVTLNSLPRRVPFELPAGYFEQLPAHLQAMANLPDADPVPGWSKTTPFEAPGAPYFANFASRMTRMAADSNEDNLLETLPAAHPFSAVPAGYFEQFSNNLIQRIQQETPVTAAAPRRRVALFPRWQLAASIALILFTGLGLLRLTNRSTEQQVFTAATSVNLNAISKDAIQDYINQNIDEFDMELIVSTINESGDPIKANLNISDREIETYLNEDGWN